MLRQQPRHLNVFSSMLPNFKQWKRHLNTVSSIYTENESVSKSSLPRQTSHLILDDFDDGILICDVQMNIHFINRAMFHLFGRDEGEMSEPINAREWLNIPDSYDGHNQFRYVIQQKYERKDDTIFIGELTIKRIFAQNNPFFIMKVRDVTEMKAMEKDAITAQKLESLGVFAEGIAHDFNNMLTAILGQTSLALHKLQNGQDVTKHLEKAMVSTQKVVDLTQQMLIYSGHDFADTSFVNLHDVIGNSHASLGISLPTNCQLHIAIDDDLPLVNVNGDQIQQSIVNVVVNAVEALERRAGDVALTVGKENVREEQIRTYCQSWMQAGEYVKIEVQDSGCGMGEETLSCIFDPFFSTKGMAHGLGLSAVIGAMRTHNGRITVDSTVGQGTTFTLYLPVPEQPTMERPDR